MIVHQEHIEVGVFVYQILQSDKVRVRSYPDILEEEEEEDNDPKRRGDFEVNELLAVDLIQPTSHATFLRLADQSGWVMADERGQVYMRQLFVETGLFSFYVDNLPHGVIVRRHPMDDTSDLLATESGPRLYRLPPMQRIYCDAVVQHPVSGVKFYRLQGGGGKAAPATPGWVCETKPAAKPGQLDQYYLLPAAKVKTGLFCYKAVCGAFIRHRPICSEASKTSRAVLQNELVVVDVIRESPYQNGNGPFLRLADGSGWLFEKKLGERAMMAVPIVTGHWVFAVMNDPVGMVLRQQPMDCQDKVFSHGIYKTGELVECDRKITNSSGVNFYRVLGTAGWLFDSRNGVPLLNLISEDTTTAAVEAEDMDTVETKPWAPDFVRGIAAIVPGTTELYFQSAGQILTLDNPDGIVVKVFCCTRSICSIFQHSSKGTIKFFRRDCSPQDLLDTLKMDLIETILAYDKFISEKLPKPLDGEETKEGGVLVSQAAQVQDEETLRLRLLVCEAEILAAHAKRRELLASILKYDDRRAKIATWMKESTERHRKANEIVPAAHTAATKEAGRSSGKQALAKTGSGNGSKYRSVSSRSNYSSNRSSYETTDDDEEGEEYADDGTDAKAPSRHRQDSEVGSQKAFACGECYRSFSGKYSRDIHCREVHKIYCETCEKIFPSFKDLERHRDNFNHW